MKKALVISYFFPPYAGGGVYRILKFVKYLPLFGWEPIVLAPRPKGYYWAFDHSLLEEISEGIALYRTTSLEPFYLFALFDRLEFRNLKNIIKDYIFIPDDKIGWGFTALLKALQIMKNQKVDLIFTSSPPQSIHLIGYALKKLTGIPWVADFRDQWTLNPLYAPPSNLIHRIDTMFERNICLACDRVIHVTYSDRAYLSQKYHVPEDKIITITNGYDKEDFHQSFPVKESDQFVLAHFGNIYGGREKTLENLLKGIELALEKSKSLSEKIRVRFYGNMENSSISLHNPKIKKIMTVQKFVPHREAVRKMLESNLLLLVLSSEDHHALTAKLFEYLAAARPILALIPDGEARNLLSRSNLGIFSNMNDPMEICETLIDLFEKKEKGALALEPDLGFIHEFERKKLTEKLSFLFDGVLGNPL